MGTGILTWATALLNPVSQSISEVVRYDLFDEAFFFSAFYVDICRYFIRRILIFCCTIALSLANYIILATKITEWNFNKLKKKILTEHYFFKS